MVVQTVVSVASRATHDHEASLAQQPKLVRGGALVHPGALREFFDGLFAVEHRPHQPQATGCPERTHRVRQGLGLLLAEWTIGGMVLGGMRHTRIVPMNKSSYFPTVGATAVAGLGLALAPQLAQAHGIADSAKDKSVGEFVPLGIEHMLTGLDHLLFIAGVVLLAGTAGRAAKLISRFVLGHSITLLVATLSGWQINATFVDVVIALSVAYVGILNLRSGEPDWRLVGTAVFAFGLVHGLGLSTRLQHLGLPEDGLFWRVIAFNVGVEIGQLIAIAAVVALGALVLRRIPRRRLQRAGALAITASGTLAALGLTIETV